MLRAESLSEIQCIAEPGEVINTVNQRLKEYRSTLPESLRKGLDESELVILLLYKLCTKTTPDVKPLTSKTIEVFRSDQQSGTTRKNQLQLFKGVYNFKDADRTYAQMIFLSAVMRKYAHESKESTLYMVHSVDESKQLDLLASISIGSDSVLFEFLSQFLYGLKPADIVRYGFAELELVCKSLSNTVDDVLVSYSFLHLLYRYFQTVEAKCGFYVIPTSLLSRWLKCNINGWKDEVKERLYSKYKCNPYTVAYAIAVENGRKSDIHLDNNLASVLYAASECYVSIEIIDYKSLALYAIMQFYMSLNWTIYDILAEIPACDVLLYYACWMLK